MQDKDNYIKDVEESALRQLSQKKIENPNDIGKSGFSSNQEKKEYKPNPLLKAIRTFKGDVEEVVNKKKESVVTIATAEEKRKDVVMEKAKETGRIAPEKEIFKPKRGLGILASSLWVTISVALIATGLITLGVLYVSRSNSNQRENVTLENKPIQYTDKKEVEMGAGYRQTITDTFKSETANYKSSVSSVLYLKFLKGKSEIKINDFSSALMPSSPDSLKRAFDKDYMSGVLSFDTNEPFFIFKVEDYGAVYSGMLKWEGSMYYDLSDIFPQLKQSTFNVNTTYTFVDYTYKNNDVRVLRNDNNEVALIYGFVDKQTLVVTANERVFNSLVQKYINAKVVR